ncbi:unnamed protein product [Nezara viridula]|uniref:Uncharacterized protein n=1 Tax=Nezara viridula TaxID=85310 RepID=A0A9P0HRB6_NEZVI|nr:unnamed protein product [Nezara viridula]
MRWVSSDLEGIQGTRELGTKADTPDPPARNTTRIKITGYISGDKQESRTGSFRAIYRIAGEVERKKKNTYDKCIPFLKDKFRETFGEREFTGRGLWFGSRGTIPKRTRSFLEELGVDIKDVAREEVSLCPVILRNAPILRSLYYAGH